MPGQASSVPDGVNRMFGEIRGHQGLSEVQHVLLCRAGSDSVYSLPPSMSSASNSLTRAGGVFGPIRARRKLV
jgi:hypothetical protein